VELSNVRLSSFLFQATLLLLVVTPAVAQAQITRDDCSTSAPASAGVSVGRSSPYFDFSRGVAGSEAGGSLLVRDGILLAGRTDLPIAGPWRARIEGSTSGWRAERLAYGPSGQVTASDTLGDVAARQLFALVGRQGGRSPVCGYVLAGGGIYSLRYKDAGVRRPGVALTAGLEIPTAHGAVQADVQLHLINTGARYPIASTDALAASVSVGWAYRFRR
jgi:hypothetical protein